MLDVAVLQQLQDRPLCALRFVQQGLINEAALSVLVGKLAATLRQPDLRSTTKNSACCPLAVCSITHGAIFAERVVLNALTHHPSRTGIFGEVDPPASEEATAATSATAAATRNNEQKIRRHDDGTDARCESESLIIGLPVRCCLFDRE
jgi:hypothetical protein